jgi:tetratricopeptide (TPR) repeat protein
MESFTASPSLTGQFDFQNVKPGHYILAVKNQSGDTVKEEHFWANGSSGEINIRLREEKAADSRGTVNIKRLNHKVPKEARKAMARYSKCRDRRDEACSLRTLSEAIQLDPDLLEAYVNRSALYARTMRWDLAIADVDQALRLDPHCAMAHSNRAFVAVHRQDYRQAIESSKAVLRTEPDNPHAKYFLALADINVGDVDHGFRELEKLAEEYEPARRTLAQAAPQRALLKAQKATLAARLKQEKIGGSASTTPKAAAGFVQE